MRNLGIPTIAGFLSAMASCAARIWKPGEPDNLGSEDYVVAWWEDNPFGTWNDAPDNGGVFAYVAEYSDSSMSAVPLPAGFSMLLAALGGLAFWRRRNPA